jgi:hypothetical protein
MSETPVRSGPPNSGIGITFYEGSFDFFGTLRQGRGRRGKMQCNSLALRYCETLCIHDETPQLISQMSKETSFIAPRDREILAAKLNGQWDMMRF